MGLVKVKCWFTIFSLAFFVHTSSHAADAMSTTVPTSTSTTTTTAPASTTTSTTTVLKPQIRTQSLTQSKYTVDTTAMTAYLDDIVMFDSSDQYEAQPYILGYANSGSLGGAGDTAYAAGIDTSEKLSSYTILKLSESLVNPDTDEELGVMTKVIGAAEVKQYGDPQTILITKSTEHIDIGSRLIPRTALDLPASLSAKTPLKAANGSVLYVTTATTGVGKSATVVISLGDRDGIQQGDLLDCMETTKKFADKSGNDASVEPTIFGEVLVYKVMEKVSLGFILSSSRPVNVGDRVMAIPKG